MQSVKMQVKMQTNSEIFHMIRERFIIEHQKFLLKYPDGTPYEIWSETQEFKDLVIVKTYLDKYISFKPFKLLQKKAMKIYNNQM
jgi:hypothetical protein